MSDDGVIRHPWQPFLPDNTRVLMLGSFPPDPHRWAMDFFYPNYINDMWRIFGLCLYGDSNRLVDEVNHTFKREDIENMLNTYGIGLYDTAVAVRRTKGTASDKDLEVVEPTDLSALLTRAHRCEAVVTTGQKATDLFTSHFGIQTPKMGQWVDFRFGQRTIRLYRMPSSSRAYPMRLEKKAEYYQTLFDQYLNINQISNIQS